jgi:hypothetical protein
MRISIRYEASWRNSFLNGSNNEPEQSSRKFIASSSSLKKEGNYKTQTITKNTVMGILNRLIGDQQKLYQARKRSNYYFNKIEETLTDDCIKDYPQFSHEIVYLRNMGAEDKGSFTGAIKNNEPIFISEYSSKFWGVIDLTLEDLCDFVIEGKEVSHITLLNPLSILARLDEIGAQKPVEVTDKLIKVDELFSTKYPDFNVSKDAQGRARVLSFYCSALYLQMERLEKELEIEIPKSSRGLLSGISKNMHTPKDFMAAYTTGKKKLAYGTPYILKPRSFKEETKMLVKAGGVLEINLNISQDKAQELREMIEAAGVSSFYLGKKGLAYVDSIRI